MRKMCLINQVSTVALILLGLCSCASTPESPNQVRSRIEILLGIQLPKTLTQVHLEIRQYDLAMTPFSAYIRLICFEAEYNSLMKALDMQHMPTGRNADYSISFGSPYWEMIQIQGVDIPTWWNPDIYSKNLPNTTFAKRTPQALLLEKYEHGSAYIVLNSEGPAP